MGKVSFKRVVGFLIFFISGIVAAQASEAVGVTLNCADLVKTEDKVASTYIRLLEATDPPLSLEQLEKIFESSDVFALSCLTEHSGHLQLRSALQELQALSGRLQVAEKQVRREVRRALKELILAQQAVAAEKQETESLVRDLGFEIGRLANSQAHAVPVRLSPEGSKLAHVSYDRQNSILSIYSLQGIGGEMMRFTAPKQISHFDYFDFTPSGKFLLVMTRNESIGNYTFQLIDLDNWQVTSSIVETGDRFMSTREQRIEMHPTEEQFLFVRRSRGSLQHSVYRFSNGKIVFDSEATEEVKWYGPHRVGFDRRDAEKNKIIFRDLREKLRSFSPQILISSRRLVLGQRKDRKGLFAVSLDQRRVIPFAIFTESHATVLAVSADESSAVLGLGSRRGTVLSLRVVNLKYLIEHPEE